jgi:hypothetical protein
MIQEHKTQSVNPSLPAYLAGARLVIRASVHASISSDMKVGKSYTFTAKSESEKVLPISFLESVLNMFLF